MNRKKSIIIVFIILTIFFTINNITFAGEIKVSINNERVENDYLEEDTYYNEMKVDHMGRLQGLKVNGGPMIAVMELDLSKFNNSLPVGFSKLNESLVLKGGGGIIGSKAGSRFGGYGLQGTTSAVGNDGKRIALELAYGGFLYEKALYSTEKVDISIGSLIGGGSARIDMIYGNFKDPHTPNSNSFDKNFMVIEPRLDFHYQFAAFVGVDLSIGYFLNLDFVNDEWKYYDDRVNLSLDRLSSPVASLKFSIGF